MKKDTSWQKVADWYKNVPQDEGSHHQALIIPKLTVQLNKYLSPGAEVLDMACGEGSVTAALQQAGYKMTGTDLARDLIDTAKVQYPEIPFFVENASRLSEDFLKKYRNHFDAITCVLAMQNIRHIKAVFMNANALLKEHGHMFIVLNHPCFRIPKASSWGFNRNSKQYRIIERYASPDTVEIIAHPGQKNSPVTLSFHRPLQDYFKAMQLNKIYVIDLEEWVSNKSSEPGPRAKAENLARREIPLFMDIVAQKLD